MKKGVALVAALICAWSIGLPAFANIRTTNADVQADFQRAYLLGGKGKNFAADKEKKNDDNEKVSPGTTVYFALQGAKVEDDDMLGSQQVPLLVDRNCFHFSYEVSQGANWVESVSLAQRPRNQLETYSNREDDTWYAALKIRDGLCTKEVETIRFQVKFTATAVGARKDKTPIGREGSALLLDGKLLLADEKDAPKETNANAAFADRSYTSSSGYAKFSTERTTQGQERVTVRWTVDNDDDPNDGKPLAQVSATGVDASFRPKLDAQMTRKQQTAFRNVKAVLRAFKGNCTLPRNATAKITLYLPFPEALAEDVRIYRQSGDLFEDVTSSFTIGREDGWVVYTAEVTKLGTYILADEAIG
ncbi:MAG: hypothetical protein HFG20_05490 [Anaerotruncus sp.]|nr:hypothetical protein [Anaerotruncus sp.]